MDKGSFVVYYRGVKLICPSLQLDPDCGASRGLDPHPIIVAQQAAAAMAREVSGSCGS